MTIFHVWVNYSFKSKCPNWWLNPNIYKYKSPHHQKNKKYSKPEQYVFFPLHCKLGRGCKCSEKEGKPRLTALLLSHIPDEKCSFNFRTPSQQADTQKNCCRVCASCCQDPDSCCTLGDTDAITYVEILSFYDFTPIVVHYCLYTHKINYFWHHIAPWWRGVIVSANIKMTNVLHSFPSGKNMFSIRQRLRKEPGHILCCDLINLTCTVQHYYHPVLHSF